jgi:oligoendopeptidase F
VDIATRIRKSGDASGYLRFLATGGSDYPIEELKLAGVDLSKPQAVEGALGVFTRSVAELDELLQKMI